MENFRAGFSNACIRIAPFPDDVKELEGLKGAGCRDFKTLRASEMPLGIRDVRLWKSQFEEGSPLVGYAIYSEGERSCRATGIIGLMELRGGSSKGRVEIRLYSCGPSDDLLSEYSMFSIFQEKIAPLLAQFSLYGNPLTEVEMVVSKENYVGQSKMGYYGFSVLRTTENNIIYYKNLMRQRV
jgi:hypothetical protein